MEADPSKGPKIFCRMARKTGTSILVIYRGGMCSHVVARANVKGLNEMKMALCG